MATAPMPRRMSVEDYLALDRASADVRYEYYDGYVIAMAGGTPQHGEVCVYIMTALTNALQGTPCRVYSSDVRVKVAAAHYVYPDVTVSCSDADRRNREILQSPRVVIEVLSPSTEKIDKGRKFRQYRACPSIEEYVLVHMDEPLIEVYRRDGRFMTYLDFGPDDMLDLTSIGVQIPLTHIYRDIEFPPEEDEL